MTPFCQICGADITPGVNGSYVIDSNPHGLPSRDIGGRWICEKCGEATLRRAAPEEEWRT